MWTSPASDSTLERWQEWFQLAWRAAQALTITNDANGIAERGGQRLEDVERLLLSIARVGNRGAMDDENFAAGFAGTSGGASYAPETTAALRDRGIR